MEDNWWGTTNPVEIEAKITDCLDNPSLPCVDYEPFLDGLPAGCVLLPLPGSVSGDNSIKAHILHDGGVRGAGVQMGMVESAEDEPSAFPWIEHPALERNVLNGEAEASSASNHATEVASIMVGIDYVADIMPDGNAYQGAAPNAKLIAEEAVTATIDDAVADLRDQGATVVNLSLAIDPDNVFAPEINRTIDDIVDTDKVTVVAGAGDQSLPSDDEIACPAEAYNVIAVGILGAQEHGGSRLWGPWTQTSAENIPGPTSGAYYPSGRCKPDLVAPGDCTVASTTANPYVNDGTGSSLSAPHVAGAVALLTEAARDLEDGGHDLTFVDEQGRVDPKALRCALLTGADKSVTARPEARPAPSWHTDSPAQPLDWHLGAGGLDVLEAKHVLFGEDEAGVERHLAFDTITWAEQSLTLPIGRLADGAALTVTLVWNAHIHGTSLDVSDLNLKILRDGEVLRESVSMIDNVEHIYIPAQESAGGDYEIVVEYFDHTVWTDTEAFALAYRILNAPSDLDGDGDVDLDDYALFAVCIGGPGVATPPDGCTAEQFGLADLDADTDVDSEDFGGFQVAFTGAG